MAKKQANPAPLGLMGFGMTTFLLNIHNAGFYPVGSMILSMGMFYGGLAQIIAGIFEFKNGNTFATTAFTSYGVFWWTLVWLWCFPKIHFETAEGEFAPLGAPVPDGFMGWYLFIWGLFTLFMFFATLKKDYTIRFVFGSLALLFFLLATKYWLKAFGLDKDTIYFSNFIGWEGIICGGSAMYYAMAQVINEEMGKVILPIGSVVVTKKNEENIEVGNEEEREKLSA